MTSLARLITFDIDGTLIKAVGSHTNRMHKNAYSYAFKKVFGVDGTIDAIDHHGSTDPSVAIRTLAHYGIPLQEATNRVDDIKKSMVEYGLSDQGKEEAGEGLSVLQGVEVLMKNLQNRSHVASGLVTGNLEDIAWLKMQALGLKPYFSTPHFGGFGSDHIERGELVKIAARRAAPLVEFGSFGLRIHVGDTPADILAAGQGGARAIGVCTGAFSRLQLEEAVKEASSSEGATILDDLADLDAFLYACDIKP